MQLYLFLQRTPLHYAVKYEHHSIVKHLVKQGAQVNCKDKNNVCMVSIVCGMYLCEADN